MKHARNWIILAISAAYLLLHLFTNYLPFSAYWLVPAMIIGVVASLFYDSGPGSWQRRLAAFGLAFLLEVGLTLLSAFLFESGQVFPARRNLFEAGDSLVQFYTLGAVLILWNAMDYLLARKSK